MSVVCYWEKQGADKLCAVHCLNAVVQGPRFSAGELGGIARELDTQERNLGFLSAGGSENVDASGNFSISVIERALARQGLQAVNLDRTDIKQSVYRNCTEQAFICNSHARAHWFSLRKVFGRWWNLDSLAPSPTTIGELGLIAFLESTLQSGFTIFVIRSLETESRVNLMDPVPSTPRKSPDQYYLTERQIEELRASAARGEQRAMDEARALGDEAPERPAFTVIAPSGKKPVEPTDWSKLGQGASLGGPQARNSDNQDDELQAALRASLDTIPPPPAEAPDGQGTNIQVRMPKGGKLQRRWSLTRSILELCGWLEYVSVKDASHGIPPLPTCNYVLIKQGFPKKDKFEKKDGSVILDGQDVSAQTLEQLQFSRQEALILQL